MAKKRRLSEKEQIKRFYRKKGIGIAIKIMAVLIAIAVIIPLSYQAYYTIVFSVLPRSDYDPEKRGGAGFSKPLKIVEKNDDSDYTLAYYYNGSWRVIEDTRLIKENIDNFVVYRNSEEWITASDRHLFVFRDNYVMSHQQLTPLTLIDDRCFRGSIKEMTKDEFEAYCQQHEIGDIYIF